MENLSERDWDNIIYDIQDGQAVLLIGPEFFTYNNIPVYQYIRETILERDASGDKRDISYYYKRDGLFLFASKSSKMRVTRDIKRLYESITPEQSILTRLAQVPFPLIISLTPDNFISRILYQKGVKHRFSYNRANENEEVEKPSPHSPLLFNMFGSIVQDDSMILDYDDVYKLLKWSLDESHLPGKFLRFFRQARTCIFLGVQFDKWYSQLALKVLNGDEEKEQPVAVRMESDNHDTEAFVLRQFKIKFIGGQIDLFNEIYDRCKRENLLRQLEEVSIFPGAVEIFNQVAKGKPGSAIDLLRTASRGTDWENEIVSLQARFNLNEKNRELTDSRDYRTEQNRIIDAIIEYARTLNQ